MSCIGGHIKHKLWHRVMRKLRVSNDIDDFITLAETSIQMGNWGLALDWYRLAAEYYPEMYPIIDGMSEALLKMDKEMIDLHMKERVAGRE